MKNKPVSRVDFININKMFYKITSNNAVFYIDQHFSQSLLKILNVDTLCADVKFGNSLFRQIFKRPTYPLRCNVSHRLRVFSTKIGGFAWMFLTLHTYKVAGTCTPACQGKSEWLLSVDSSWRNSSLRTCVGVMRCVWTTAYSFSPRD